MHIGIDISALNQLHVYRGSGSYIDNLVESLDKSGYGIKITLITRKQKIPKNVDIIHYPYFDPFFLTIPEPGIPFVVTVHDLIPIRYAKYFPVGHRGWFKWQIQKNRLRQADMILTDSYASKADLDYFLSVESVKVRVVRLSPDPVFSPETDAGILDEARTQLDLPEKYFLYVGDVNWNKNIPGLIAAWADFCHSGIGGNIKLVLAGNAFGRQDLPEIQQIMYLLKSNKINNRIKIYSKLQKKQLRLVYNAALFYIQPSFAEGFGLPPLEAMSCAIPAIVSIAPALNEIAGPSLRFNPHRKEEIVCALKTAATITPKNYLLLKKAAFSWAKRYSWKKVARETYEVYQKILHQ